MAAADTIHADVAIIGTGPAGAAAAIHLGQLGVRNVVLVDRADFPRDKTCGSGISPKGLKVLKALGAWETVEPHSYWIRGVRLVTPGDRELVLSGGDETAAVICCRRTLDQILLNRALSLGVQFLSRFDTNELIHEKGRVTGFSAADGRIVRAGYTVIANGAHSKFSVDRRPKRVMQAIMGWWDNVPFKSNHVEMIFDRMLSPCYGWLFPESASRVNIGICYEDVHHKKNSRTLFHQFLQKHFHQRLAGASQIGDWKGHPISYSYRIGPLHSPGRLVIGEAGRMTHPATAEGIYQGMHSGMIAAEALKDVLSRPNAEDEAWTRYEARCRSAFRVSFWSGKVWRRAVESAMLDSVVGLCSSRLGKRALNKLMAEM